MDADNGLPDLAIRNIRGPCTHSKLAHDRCMMDQQAKSLE